MSAKVEITWLCSGCDETFEVESQRVERRFRSVSGRDYGIGGWVWDAPEIASTFPGGWSQDPYTGSDYCPKCAAEIWPEQEGADDGE